MNRTRLLPLFTLLVCAATVPGPQQTISADQDPAEKQETTAQPSAAQDKGKPKTDVDVVRISVTLVQIDAVVTDQKGKHVTDLKPEDFELFEDNRRQQITNFSYVSARPAHGEVTARPSAPPNPNTRPGPPVGSVRLRPDQVRRTIALVVDDIGMSFESIGAVKQSLRKFVDEQMEAGDLVAIIRTGAGVGALQQFTADKRQLHAAIERVRFNLMFGGGHGAFSSMSAAPFAGDTGFGAARMRTFISSSSVTREEMFTTGTLGTIGLIVNGLKDLPGRKSVILLSDGFQLLRSSDFRVLEATRRLVDAANRASVVVYTIDPRGQQTTGLTAADSTAFHSLADLNRVSSDRGTQLFQTQGGLNYLANQTGGFFIRNTNNLSEGVGRVLDDQEGYYLIGYIPEPSSFKTASGKRAFHNLNLRIKRAGLRVRSRTGFYGLTDEEASPASSGTQQIIKAITSPFTSGDINLKLTSLFGHDAKEGSFMRSIMHIDARDISFSEEQAGQRKATIEIVAFTFASHGEIVGREARGYNLSVRSDGFQKLLDDGFIYALNVPIKKPGGYQLRIAVRDPRAERVGSASQFIDVPDIGKNRLTLSGLVVSGYDPATARRSAAPGSALQAEDNNGGGVEAIDPASTPAVRMLKRGTYLDYGFLIYNAQLNSKTKKPQLESQLLLFKDGRQVFVGKALPLALGEEPDWKHIPASGRLRLGDDLAPGEYVLQIIVADKLAKEKDRWASQWMDFEIVK
jgi:VWFA-related protein